MTNKMGYDAPQRERQDDFLGRWRFAADVFRVANETPKDWSVRLGIFAKWGEGKTTILRFIERMAASEEYIPVWFAPWSARSWDDLWAEFAAAIVEALEAQNLAPKTIRRLRLKLLGRKTQKYAKQVTTELSGLSAVAKPAVGAGFAFLQQFLDVNGADFQTLLSELDGWRVIVFVDDLDRVDPRLVPQLLLALRELLDLPGFVFVLAFDDEIVSRALTAYHTAWDSGQAFLEKIIDFRFPVPRATPVHIQKLFAASLRTYCPFVDPGVTEQVADLLPLNPRKVKALIRHLTALQGEVQRYDANALNWVDIVIAQSLRLESEAFFDALLHAKRLEELTFSAFRVRRERAESERKEDHEIELEDLLKEADVSDNATKERIKTLMEAQRARGSFEFRSMAELSVRPRLITDKEFRGAVDRGLEKHNIAQLENWLKDHALQRSADIRDVAEEFFAALINHRDALLEMAADVQSADDHLAALKDAQMALALVRQILLGSGQWLRDLINTPPSFAKIFGQAMKWLHFYRNPSEPEPRAEERQLLIDVAHAHHGRDANAYLDVLRPWSLEMTWDVGAVDAESAEKRSHLRLDLVSIIAPAVAESVLKSFEMPGGIRQFSEANRKTAEKYILLNPNSPLWTEPMKARFNAALDTVGKTSVGQDNLRALLDLLVQGLRSQLEGASAEDIKVFLRERRFVHLLWSGVIAGRIQYRFQLEILKARAALIGAGAAKSDLPIPEWLAPRQSELGQRPQAPAAPPNDASPPTNGAT